MELRATCELGRTFKITGRHRSKSNVRSRSKHASKTIDVHAISSWHGFLAINPKFHHGTLAVTKLSALDWNFGNSRFRLAGAGEDLTTLVNGLLMIMSDMIGLKGMLAST